jgi:hypothetical protein
MDFDIEIDTAVSNETHVTNRKIVNFDDKVIDGPV